MLSEEKGKLENGSEVPSCGSCLAASLHHLLSAKPNIASSDKGEMFTGSRSRNRAKDAFGDETLNDDDKDEALN